jgi:hypothetical protein
LFEFREGNKISLPLQGETNSGRQFLGFYRFIAKGKELNGSGKKGDSLGTISAWEGRMQG